MGTQDYPRKGDFGNWSNVTQFVVFWFQRSKKGGGMAIGMGLTERIWGCVKFPIVTVGPDSTVSDDVSKSPPTINSEAKILNHIITRKESSQSMSDTCTWKDWKVERWRMIGDHGGSRSGSCSRDYCDENDFGGTVSCGWMGFGRSSIISNSIYLSMGATRSFLMVIIHCIQLILKFECDKYQLEWSKFFSI